MGRLLKRAPLWGGGGTWFTVGVTEEVNGNELGI